ncbi:hypothetical protein ACIP98_01250 [Streptomyces sp. NPDC088354]|uniref:hypothetical protein n=1 Tax=Streptomyces sp. NPDC088354 TaxID=3365856 RepID=UPI003819C7FE
MIVKIAIVSHGVPSTMLELVSAAGPVQVIVGTIILLLPFSGIIVVYANDEIYKRSGMSEVAKNEVRLGVYLAIFVLSFLLVWYWVVSVVILLAVRHLLFLRDKKKGRTVDSAEPIPLEEWLKKEPSDVRLHELWIEAKEKIDELNGARRAGTVDLARISTLRNSVQETIDEFNGRAAEIRKFQYSQGTAVASVLASYAFALLIQFLGSDTPWIPAEQVNVKGGGREIGYVIQAGDSWTTLLDESSRSVIRIPSDSIASRKVCSVKGQEKGTETLWRLADGHATVYKRCPSPKPGR